MIERGRPKLFSIPPGEPFLTVLVDRLMDGTLIEGLPDPLDPLSLARATILLPTRRACRALQEVFLARAGPALLMPRIRPIGEVDEDELQFDEPGEDIEADPALPPPISPLGRRLVLTRLILAWARALASTGGPALVPASPADAAYLAAELARLMDMVATENVPWDGLKAMLPQEMQEHWALTLTFLSIATETWPAYLAEIGAIEPAERRRRLIEAEAARLSRLPPHPVIAAGSTGSIPATANLLVTIAHLPKGAVVLPGLDRDLDAEAWDGLMRAEGALVDPVPSHPQAVMRHLLASMRQAQRSEAVVLTSRAPTPRARARERLLSEAMRPADTTDRWSSRRFDAMELDAALDGLVLVEAAGEQEEALAIAALLRQALEHPDATAALVTPDRLLARRVAAELARFGLAVDDTSGVPLAETPAGIVARLVAEVARDGLEPIGLLALLKHPLAAFGLEPHEARRAARALERAVLRGVRPAAGLAGLRAAFHAAPSPQRNNAASGLTAEDRRLAARLLDALDEALKPLESLLQPGRDDALSDLAEAHEAALDMVVATPDRRGPLALRDDGRELQRFFAELLDEGSDALTIEATAYPELVLAFMAGRTVRAPRGNDPRLRVYGLLEARLMRHDRLILGGLNEGTWPATTRTDPWLSRTMRGDMALPAPERRIGLSAHDFVQALGTHDAVMTRAAKSGGTPTVPSRWLQRLAAVTGMDAMTSLKARGDAVLALVRGIDEAKAPPRPVARPAPAPPVEARPRRLSVTEIETLIRDPYSIYARHVLRLAPFETIAQDPGAAERGTIIHAVLAEYAETVTRGAAPSEALLVDIGRRHFAGIVARRDLHAFWWPRFLRLVPWFIGFDTERRMAGSKIVVEASGKIVLEAPGGPFELRGRADRIEQRPDGTVAVIDFKTGQPPTEKLVRVGFAPQLPLEAAMVAYGGFAEAGLARGLTPSELAYVKLAGGDPPALVTTVKPPERQSVEAFASATLAALEALIRRFDDPDTGYASLVGSQFALRYGEYDHLARAKEWGLVAEDDAS